LAGLYSFPSKNIVFDSPEDIHSSTSENIISCKFIVLLFEHKGQKDLDVGQDVVARGGYRRTEVTILDYDAH